MSLISEVPTNVSSLMPIDEEEESSSESSLSEESDAELERDSRGRV